jgi:short-subunit dehydrogenase
MVPLGIWLQRRRRTRVDTLTSESRIPRTRTALVTGASSGIGAAFARSLAARRYNLILVARREEVLKQLAADLAQRYPIEVEVLAADLADPDQVTHVANRIAASRLDLLVNDAGFGVAGTFVEADFDRLLSMIQVHVLASVRLTRAALPGMIARRHGAIINVSSMAALMPKPLDVTYCATKAYLNVFSEALQGELQGTGVRVQALCPGFTVTEFHDTPEYERLKVRRRIPRTFWMSADAVVAESLTALERGSVVCIPGVKNRLLAVVIRSGVASFLIRVLAARFRSVPA